MKRIALLIALAALALSGCALRGYWNLRGYEREVCTDKRLSKCRTTLKIPGKYRGCMASAKGYIWFSGNKQGRFVREVTTRVKCPGRKLETQRTVFKGTFKVVRQHGLTYLVVQHQFSSQKLTLDKTLNRLYVIDINKTFTMYEKDGRISPKLLFIVNTVKYSK